MQYEKSLPLHGNEDKALDLAFATFATSGLRVTARTESTIDVAGPSPHARTGGMIGAMSRAHLRVGGGIVTLRAEFAGLRRVPIVIACALTAVSAIVLAVFWLFAALGILPGYMTILGLLPILPFCLIVPLMLAHFRRRAAAELDAFLNNLTMVGPR